jgi:hypothetical protein
MPLVILLLCLWAFAVGCGSGGGTLVLPYPAPFNAAKGEGKLINTKLVVTYPTGSTGTQPGLDAEYTQAICMGLTASQCAANEASLNTPPFGNFDVTKDPIANNALGIKAIDAVKIDYIALNVDQSAVTVSGGIVIPNVAPASLKGLILYFHGTTAQRSFVPSNFLTPANPNGDGEGPLLAAIWASQGYVVVMPDYVGLGDDQTHPHPYILYPSQSAQSGLAMMRAARTLLANYYGITGPLPLFITGYSEGGSYSLEAEHLMQNNPLYASALNVTLRKAAPLSGAFDLTGTMVPYFLDDVTATHNNWYSLDPEESGLSKPYLTAYFGLGFASYSGVAPTDIFAGAFYTCATTSACSGSKNLMDLFYNSALVNGDTADADDIIALLAYDQAVLVKYNVNSNAITPLLTDTYATALMRLDTANPLYKQLAGANTYHFVPSVPVTLVSLMEDSLVTRKNTDVAFSYFEKQNPGGPYKEDLVNNANFLVEGLSSASPVDHSTELPFMSVLLLNEFNTTT